MLLQLIKNEFIKLYKRPKTIVTVVLLFLGLTGLAGVLYIEDKRNELYDSIDYRLEMAKDGIKNYNEWIPETKERIKKLEESNNKGSDNEKELMYAKEELADYERYFKEEKVNLKNLEEEKKNPRTWQQNLENYNKGLKEELKALEIEDPNNYKENVKRDIQMNQYYLDNNIEPIHESDFGPANLMIMWSMIVAMAIPVFIAIFGSDIVADENTNETFKFLLIQPVSRGKILLSKFIALTTSCVALIIGGQAIICGVVGAFVGFKDATMLTVIGRKYEMTKDALMNGYYDVRPIAGSGQIVTRGEMISQAMLVQVFFIIACCAVVFMFSTVCKSNMIAVAVSTVVLTCGIFVQIMIPTLGVVAHFNFLTYGFGMPIIAGEIPNVMQTLKATPEMGILVMVVTSLVSYFISQFVFKRKDILV